MDGRRLFVSWLRALAAYVTVLAATVGSAYGEPPKPKPTKPVTPSLQQRVATLVANYKKTAKTTVGVSVRRCNDGKQVVGIRSRELFVPASNQKILTSAFALARLGGKFQFDTRVYARGGDLVVVGDFDPTLGDPILAARTGRSVYADLDEWAAAAKKHFGRRPVKRIVLLTGRGKEPLRHPDWPAKQRNQWYAAPVSAVNFFNNCVDTTIRVTDGRATPMMAPVSRFIRVTNTLTVDKKGRWGLIAKRDMSEVTYGGKVPGTIRKPVSTAIDDPSMLLGRTLADRLVRAGVTFAGTMVEQTDSDGALKGAKLLTRTKRPLRAAMWRMNKRSLNMAAESVLLRAGDGTWAGSAKIMTRALTATYGVDPHLLQVRDGSGLSGKNRVAPRAVTHLLAGILKRDDWAVFVNSLPLGGVEGRVSRRLTSPPYRGRVLAKTGHIEGVQALSGYILDTRNRPVLAYSILVNKVPSRQGDPAKRLHEAICRALVDHVDGRAAK
ncbi:MAG: D-alanyl-D-alanine carboxypeptidase/D-alanyl-D-alanine endopeptidase [Planctomycetota bacterium]